MTEIRIDCPFVDHTSRKTVAVNEEEGVAYCHACHKGWSLEEVENYKPNRFPLSHERSSTVVEDVGTTPDTGLPALDTKSLSVAVGEYLTERRLEGVDWEPSPDRESYARFYSEGRETYQDRRMGNEEVDIPRYVSDSGELFWATGRADAGGITWLSEGVADAFALRQCGLGASVASLGSSLSSRQAYDLRGQFVVILYDADSAGYSGARKASEKLREMDVPHGIIDLERDMRDPSEAYTNDPEAFVVWLRKKARKYLSTENSYVEDLFSGNQETFRVIPTKHDKLNRIFGGGLKGCNVLAGTPGAGKTGFVVDIITPMATAGYKCLVVSGELSKAQMWARVASTDGRAPAWSELEADPTLLSKAGRKRMKSLADNLHIRVGMSLSRILHIASAYDIVVVDYIQRLPEIEGADDTNRAVSVGNAMKKLANLARDENKVVLAISSMARSSYDSKGLGIFKESGDIEYVVSGAMKIEGATDRKVLTVLKNTRGKKMTAVVFDSDLGHCQFQEVCS